MIELEGVCVGRIKDTHRVMVNPDDAQRATTVDLPCPSRTKAGGFSQRPAGVPNGTGSSVSVTIKIEAKS